MLCFMIMVLYGSCVYDKLELQPKPCSCGVDHYDSFAQHVWPIINQKCVTCHNPGAGIDLSDYSKIKPFADSGVLLGVITSDPNYFSMPPDHPMDSCSIYIIRKWIDQGALNN